MPTWTPLKTWTTLTPLPAADLNTYVRDDVGCLSYPGLCMWYTAGTTAPGGWLIGDGSAVSRTTYSALNSAYSAVGYPFGAGDGSTTFNMPDLRGRTPIGLDVASVRISGYTGLGSNGGEQNHTLSIGELAAHNHSASSSSSAGGHTHSLGTSTNMSGGAITTFSNAAMGSGAQGPITFFSDGTNLVATASDSISTSTTTSNTGSGTGHNTMQPSIAGLWIVKT